MIHFTRRRRHAREDLASTVRVADHQVVVRDKAIRVLGVWLDPKLTWKEHIAHASRKGLAAFSALSRMAASTWGPSARHTRLLYTAVVRPTLLYGAQEWSIRNDGKPLATSTTDALGKVQNKCLRRVTGGYKRTPRAALERETQVMPIDLYTEVVIGQRAVKTRGHQVESQIARAADAVWTRMRSAGRPQQRPATGREIAAALAITRAQEARERLATLRRERQGTRRSRGTHRRADTTSPALGEASLIARWGTLAWQRRWEKTIETLPRRRPATVWNTPWEQDPRKLYAGLSKAQATALFLLRTEVIGLNAWLASIRVPDVTPACPCGWFAQTVQHVMLQCPRHNRIDLIQRCGTERLEQILIRPDCAKHAARWFIRAGILEQFRVAKEIEEENTEEFRPFETVERWDW
jgi:hypothetical protein